MSDTPHTAHYLAPDHRAADRLADEAFPAQAGVQSTHYDDCWRDHPACAFHLGAVRGYNAATQEATDA